MLRSAHVNWIIFTLLIFTFKHTTSFSQDKNLIPDIDNEIISAFHQIKDKPLPHAKEPCQINTNWSIEQNLEQANAYNLNGNWKCCEDIFQAISKIQNQLSGIEKLHVLLAQEYQCLKDVQ